MSVAFALRRFGTLDRPLRLGVFARKAGFLLAATFVAASLLWCDSASAASPRVILLRGWFGVFSTGLDTIADRLKAQGVRAEVVGHLDWSNKLAEVLRERAAGDTAPLVLIGHSQGANNVIDMARSLEPYHITVDLMVTLSPFMQNPVPANVAKAINYYKSPGWGSPLTADAGLNGNILNVNLSDDPTILHISIDKSSRIQSDILREIAALNENVPPTRTAAGLTTSR
jgi:hypothetical protein